MSPAATGLSLRALSPAEHGHHLRGRRAATDAGLGGVSFLQSPAWALVKEGWRAEGVGWFGADGRPAGAALVLFRRLPGVRRSFAYLPEGPVLDWSAPDLAERWLAPLCAWLGERGAFTVRIGPPLPYRRWSAGTLKQAVGHGRRVRDVLPDRVEPLGAAVADRLGEAGWRRCQDDAQPRFVLEVPLAGRSLDDLWTGLNQEWRRNVKRAGRAGVRTDVADAGALPDFHRLLGVTERRDGFRLGRSLAYYERQYAALNADGPGTMRLYTARHGGEILAAHTLIRSPDGARAWYQTGASADHRREVRPSNALQWRMLCDAHGEGASAYDMRGVPTTLDPGDREFGLLRWKLGTGGEVVETLGEWELPLHGTVNRTLHRAVQGYLARPRGAATAQHPPRERER